MSLVDKHSDCKEHLEKSGAGCGRDKVLPN